MAEALLRVRGGDRFEAASAGVDPRGVHPLTIRALARVGIDASAARSKSISEFLDQPFDRVVTVCDRARESCPVFPGAGRSVHWSFEDPAEADGDEDARLAVFERVRDEIDEQIRALVAEVSADGG